MFLLVYQMGDSCELCPVCEAGLIADALRTHRPQMNGQGWRATGGGLAEERDVLSGEVWCDDYFCNECLFLSIYITMLI